MASSSTQKPSSSSSAPTPKRNFDVFLSFRGEDTRCSFTDHLFESLKRMGINTFRDDKLERGEEISQELLESIEGSRLSIIVFPKKYAESKCCLNELATIMECRKKKDQKVFPVFYHVDLADVRTQTKSFEEAFFDHEKNVDKEKVQGWRAAMTEASKLGGWHVKDGYESKAINEITEDIFKRFPKLLHMEDHIVGMDFRLEELKSLLNIHLDGIRMVGIYGIGGIGKTTIAKMVYNDILCQFDGSSFLEGVNSRSNYHSNGILQLLQELLRDILLDKYLELNNINDGFNMIKGRLGSKKFLLVIDDVDDLDLVKLLIGDGKGFGSGTRIIITTRDKQLLDRYGVVPYEAKVLCDEEAIELFSWHAFNQNTPKEDYVDVSNSMVKYVQGLPLAIRVLGSYLYGMTIDEWKSTLEKLTKELDKKIYNVLKTSYDGLGDLDKEIFLDIACFFKGQDKDSVLRILEGCNFYPMSGMKVLCDRCLISISNNIVSMHDLIQQMGWTIIRKKYPKDPSQWSRLWDPYDIRRAFLGGRGMKNVEVISYDLSRSKEIQFNTKVFAKMKRLRLLKVYWSNHCGKVMLPPNFEFPSQELRYLHWEGYPLKTLPSNFNGENLVELRLRNSTIKRLWKGSKGLENLKVIDLSYSQRLIKMSKFSSMPNLKKLNLKGCLSLQKLHPSIGALKMLTDLNLGRCEKLQSLPSSMKFESLEVLYLNDCRNLENFPEIQYGDMKHLKTLYLNKSGIKELSSSIGFLTSLKILHLSKCSNLEKFPKLHGNMKHLEKLYLDGSGIKEVSSSIGSLTSLEILDLSGCSKFEKFPNVFEHMVHLKELRLYQSGIKELPSSIGYLEFLQTLSLSHCTNFEKFPENIQGNMKHLKGLSLDYTAIKELPNSIGCLEALQTLSLRGCSKFEKFPENILGNMKHLRKLSLDHTAIKELPNSIGCLEALQTLSLHACKIFEKFPKIQRNIGIRRLDLQGTAIIELPCSIGYLTGLKTLNLENCQNLSSLPSSICELKSLKGLSLNGCSNLKAFPEIMEEMEHLEHLFLNGTTITELPSSIEHLRGLKYLELINCENLEILPNSIGNMTSLSSLLVRNCSKLHNLPDNLRSLQCCLTTLDVGGCNLMEGAIPSDLWCLSSLEVLDVSENHIRRIPSGIIQLSKLSNLVMNHCSMLEEIPELPSSLRRIQAHGCPCLETLSSPTNLLWSSLLNCFKSLIQNLVCNSDEETGIFVQNLVCNSDEETDHSDEETDRSDDEEDQIAVVWPGNSGIPKWVRHQNMGCEVRIELPMKWYEDNNFLGFVLFFHLLPTDDDDDEWENKYIDSLACELRLSNGDQSEQVDRLWFDFNCKTYWISGLSHSHRCYDSVGTSYPALWVSYFPQIVIPSKYRCSQWNNFSAHFDTPLSCGSYQCGDSVVFSVKSCGISLIFAKDHHQHNHNHWPQLLRENTSFNVKRIHDDTADDTDHHHKRSRHV